MNINDLNTSMINVNIPKIKELEGELRSILEFWGKNTCDDVNGGFVAELNAEGKQTEATEKGAVLNARLLWTFSAAYNFLKEPEYLTLAKRAYDYLVKFFWDKKNGGVYWSVNKDGSVLNNRKQAYAQGFAIYGFSEYYKASKNQESLNYAIELFKLIENHYMCSKHGGYIEALSDNWQALEDMRLSDKDANEPKSMNTHLHIIEPYTNLFRVWPNQVLKESIQEQIRVFKDKIIDTETYHFNLFFDYDWSVKSNIVSYGHDIEGAWLLNEAAHVIQDQNLMDKMKKLSLNMAEITLLSGLDVDGSMVYELENGHLDTDKHWWPQAEALVGFIDAFQNSGELKYMNAANKIWQFILNFIKDEKNGEWYWKVDENGNPDISLPKVGFWKCPYHNSRALMEAITRIKSMKLK
ncbi:AGE family epimerase/isomerase [Labilibacter marinus]|uniref:AGE family epimerase/isomerase n=1 Tax=Labilibacter marinus TaxID=1477105 RepID=UPI001E32A58E|nr:AGE family epimerase/isomerase [Labilibacter marinus]